MPFLTKPPLPFNAPKSRLGRYLLAVLILAGATALRAAIDPLIHAQIPYFIYVASVVVATWFCGADGGVLNTVLAAFVGNYFFVEPRYVLTPEPQDWMAMGLFSLVALGLVWLVGRWKRTERALRRANDETTAVLEQIPVGVVIANESGRLLFGNSAMERIFGLAFIPSVDSDQYDAYRAFHPDGRPVQAEEHPMSRSLAGETVRDEEMHILRGDGTKAILSASSAPICAEDGRITGGVMALLDITTQKAAGEALRQRAEELQAIVDTVPAAVFVTRDPSARRMDGNRFAAEYLRLPVGSNMSKTAPPEEQPTTFRAIKDGRELSADELPVQRAMALGAAVRDCELDFVYEDGTSRTVFGNAMPLRDDAGNVRGSVGAFVDITERKRSEEALRDANRMKDEFLATLSHELRTPLNAIVGWSSMLVQGGLPADAVRRAHEAIFRNAEAQRNLIDDVLDVSRIVTGKLRLESGQADVAAAVRGAIEAVRLAAEAKHLTVISEFAAGPLWVAGDSARLQQVFWNLLANAVKFTAAGGTITVTTEPADSQVRVRVEDSGIGIAPEFLPYVFERFRQHDSSSTRMHSGLGLGLSIVRNLVELHGGTVQAASEGRGRGSVFTVTLPAARYEERRRGPAPVPRRGDAITSVPPAPPPLCGVRVLVVDDEPDARELASAALGHHGAIVVTAASAAEALRELPRADPAVLVVDLAMPEMDGYALLQAIRTRGGASAQVPAIALTAYAREEDREQALACGFAMHIAKPVQAHTLVTAVASAARRGHGDRGHGDR